MIVIMLLDIGVGVLLGVTWHAAGFYGSLAATVIFGVFSALSPDLDFIYHLSKGGSTKNAHRHRELLHNPLVFIPLGAAVTALIEPAVAGLFALGALSHMIHDSIGIGWGVQWLFPFSKNHYALGYRVRTGNHARLPKQKYYVWKNEEMDELTKKYGDPNWFANTYKRWHPFAIVETLVFVLALGVLYVYTR
jgi:hypothetical protein